MDVARPQTSSEFNKAKIVIIAFVAGGCDVGLRMNQKLHRVFAALNGGRTGIILSRRAIDAGRIGNPW